MTGRPGRNPSGLPFFWSFIFLPLSFLPLPFCVPRCLSFQLLIYSFFQFQLPIQLPFPHLCPSTCRVCLRLQLFRPPAATEYGTYARLLRDELETWRVRLQGEGQFEVELSRPKAAQPGTMGVVRIGLSAGRPKRAGTPAAVEHVLQQLRGDDAFPQVGGEGLTVASDLLLFHGGDYYFVKPLVRRLWLATAAAQDAWRIVQTVRQGAPIQ